MEKGLLFDMAAFLAKAEGFPCPDRVKYMEELVMPMAESIHQQKAQRERVLVGIQGYQGVGKTTVCRLVQQVLQEKYRHRVRAISIDDVYKTYQDRVALRQSQDFLRWRGPPGTHDIDILEGIVSDFKEGGSMRLVRFDKSLHQGQGDRLDQVEEVQGADILLLEGWFINLWPIPDFSFESQQNAYSHLGGPSLEMKRLSEFSNRQLREYTDLWEQLDYSNSRKWRT